MSNVGRHKGGNGLNSKRCCSSSCLRWAPLAAMARAVRPLAAGAPPWRLYRFSANARSGCPSCGGQRTARWSSEQGQTVGSIRTSCAAELRTSEVGGSSCTFCAASLKVPRVSAVRKQGQSTLSVMQVAVPCNSRPRACALGERRKAEVHASMPPNTSIERTCHGRLRLPRHAAHVERYASSFHT
jgi:hypothetical protein